MGKKATFVKARLGEIHQKKVVRGKRADDLKKKRRGEESGSRLVQRVLVGRSLPSGDNSVLLLQQFEQACRLPTPSEDLCNMMKAAVPEDSSSAKNLIAIASKLVEIATTDLSAKSLFCQIISDENGSRVVVVCIAILTAIKNHSLQHKLCDLALACFESNPGLMHHFVASKVLSSAAVNGRVENCARILKLFEAEFSTSTDVATILKDRHVASILVRLLSTHRSEATQWLSAKLRIVAPEEKPLKRHRKETTTDDKNELTKEEIGTTLRDLMEDPVSAPVVHELISDSNRWVIYSALNFNSLLTSKRANRFLMKLLEVDGEGPNEVATKLLNSILMGNLEEPTNLVDASFDSTFNFTVQKVIALIERVDENAAVFHRRIMDIFGSRLSEMAVHPIGTHVVVRLIEASSRLQDKNASLKAVAEILCRPESTLDLIRNNNGSLVVRKLVEKCAHGGPAAFLISTIEQHMHALMYDATGNLIVQQLLQSGGTAGAGAFFKKFMRGEELLNAAQHLCASHVVHTLFDCVDPPVFAEICGALKPHVCNLAKHINGRFIVEKMIPSQRDVRESLARQFVPLAMAKGTQHLLCSLFDHVDANTRSNLIQNIIHPQFRQLATNPTSSIVLQKLLQNNAEFLASTKKWASQQGPSFLRELSQNFFGKFVVQILTSWHA